jgi:predicted metal-dependent enzyme (double-stranded beta helix superfamily)
MRSDANMSTTVQAALDLPQLAEIVRSFAANPQDWIARVRLDAEGRWYEQIHASEGYDVWVITWQPGQATGFHDHGRSAGAFTVAWGALEEHHDDTTETIGDASTRMFGPGFVHDVRNATTAPVVSVHAYSPPLAEMTRYELTAHGLVARGTETEANW